MQPCLHSLIPSIYYRIARFNMVHIAAHSLVHICVYFLLMVNHFPYNMKNNLKALKPILIMLCLLHDCVKMCVSCCYSVAAFDKLTAFNDIVETGTLDGI